MRLRNSVWVEALLLVLVYVVGVGFLWRRQMALRRTQLAWGDRQRDMAAVARRLVAGLVSLPLFQFLLLRWYFRLFMWARFLWHVSRHRAESHTDPSGPRRRPGLPRDRRVARSRCCCWPKGYCWPGRWPTGSSTPARSCPQFKVELIGLVTVMVFAVLGPLLVFMRQLEAAKRAGLREYGALAQRYMREFDRKWLRGGAPPDEPLLGSADIQSLADMGNSFDVVKEMRWIPFTLSNGGAVGGDHPAARCCRWG